MRKQGKVNVDLPASCMLIGLLMSIGTAAASDVRSFDLVGTTLGMGRDEAVSTAEKNGWQISKKLEEEKFFPRRIDSKCSKIPNRWECIKNNSQYSVKYISGVTLNKNKNQLILGFSSPETGEQLVSIFYLLDAKSEGVSCDNYKKSAIKKYGQPDRVQGDTLIWSEVSDDDKKKLKPGRPLMYTECGKTFHAARITDFPAQAADRQKLSEIEERVREKRPQGKLF